MRGLSIVSALALVGLIIAPASADFLDSSNGGFEDPWPSTPAWGGSIGRDSTIFGPGGPFAGSHYGSVQSGGQNINLSATLTSITVPPSTVVTLTGVVAGGTNGGTPAQLYVQLIDGSSTGDVLEQEWRVTLPVTYGFPWTPITLSGHIASGHVKIKFGIQTSGAWSSGTGLHVDDLHLTPEPASMGLLALAGLPLVFGRRRRA